MLQELKSSDSDNAIIQILHSTKRRLYEYLNLCVYLNFESVDCLNLNMSVHFKHLQRRSLFDIPGLD